MYIYFGFGCNPMSIFIGFVFSTIISIFESKTIAQPIRNNCVDLDMNQDQFFFTVVLIKCISISDDC